jgi:hypothetical protein
VNKNIKAESFSSTFFSNLIQLSLSLHFFVYILSNFPQKIGFDAGLPDFLLIKYFQNMVKYTKFTLNYQMAIKYTKWPIYTPHGHKMYQHFSLQDTPKFTQSRIFCFENIPYGNPALM